jgi:hypothetical protein
VAVKTFGLPVAANVSPAAVGTSKLSAAAAPPGMVKLAVTGNFEVPTVTSPVTETGVPVPVFPSTEYVAVTTSPAAGELGLTLRLTETAI